MCHYIGDFTITGIIRFLNIRLNNKYTIMGLTILVSQLEHLKILPVGDLKIVPGMPLKQVIIPIIIFIGIYLVFHIPVFKPKNRLQKKQEELDLLKIDIDILRAKKQLKEETYASSNKSLEKSITDN